ncbi:MAG TPA: indole-3-glycerol phosphate synthase TrpC [Verrucomicrobiales bacterium]|nr:indole-3-glycerol phosphate synthase TrpC [Verrucomicrobiales bacterium]
MNRLGEILAHKEEEIRLLLPREDKLRHAAAERNDFRSLESALRGTDDGLAVIAEVKKASPSAGVIAEEFDPVATAMAYAAGGAAGISVLTDERFFQGSLAYVSQVRAAVGLPVLRKDFLLHEAQIYESVVAGADAILLIVAALPQDRLIRLLELAHSYQLEVLVEVHDVVELDRALETEARMIGINNRNLQTFEVDLQTTRRLSGGVDEGLLLISESGIGTEEDADIVRTWGADAILVGEALMRSGDASGALAALRRAGSRAAAM